MKNKILLGACALVAIALAAPAAAQSYPSKPVRFILPFPPGGPTDILGRIIGQRLAVQLNQPVVPENRPGAGGNVGTDCTPARPRMAMRIVLSVAVPVDQPRRCTRSSATIPSKICADTLVAIIPEWFARPSIGARENAQGVRSARAGRIRASSTLARAVSVLRPRSAARAAERLAGLNMVHVPYKGSGQALDRHDRRRGRHGCHRRAGGNLSYSRRVSVRPLAVLAPNRLPLISQVPTSKEAGVERTSKSYLVGILAPAGTPREMINA